MGNSRRYDLKPGIGVAVVAVVLLFAEKIDGITFVAFLFRCVWNSWCDLPKTGR